MSNENNLYLSWNSLYSFSVTSNPSLTSEFSVTEVITGTSSSVANTEQREKTKTWKDKTFIEIDGETKTYREWQEFYNFSDSVLNYRKKVVGLCGADLFKVKKHGKELYMSERKHF